jgi:NADPH:quinone reductase-like Zn-dependent oxidoreductase
MNGDSDKMVPTKNTVDLDRRLPNSQLVSYPDAGHGGVFQFHEDFADVFSGYDVVLDSLGGQNLEKSLTVLKPGGQAISVTGPPDPGFAKQLGAPKFMGVVMGLLSRKVHNQARKLGVSYSFLFMQANGAQLRELAALYDAGQLRPVIDKTFPFDQTLQALAYVEQGRANGKVVITLD